MKRKITALTLIIVILAVSFLPTLTVSASAQEKDFCAGYYQYVYSENTGFPENCVYDIAQKSDGTLCFATASGLIEYSGFSSYDVYNKETVEGQKFSLVLTVFVDSKDREWLGTNNVGLICKTGDSFKSFDISSGAPSNSVRDIKETADGTIIVATANGIYSIDGEDNITVYDNTSGASTQGYQLIPDLSAESDFLCVTNTGFVAKINGTEISETIDYHGITENIIKDIDYVDPNTYRVGTDTGEVIEVVNKDGVQTLKTLAQTDSPVYKMIRDSSGLCWVICRNGIGYIDAASVYHSVRNIQLDGISSVICDFQGNYWFSTYNGGVVELCRSYFTDINDCYSLGDSMVNCVIKHNGLLYSGTENGLSVIDESAGEVISNELTKRLDGVNIKAMAVHHDGRLLIGTAGEGVFSYDSKGGIRQITTEQGLISDSVNTLAVMSDGDIIVGFDDGITILEIENTSRSYNEENGIAGKVLSIKSVPKMNFCIVGTESNGAYKIEKDGGVYPFDGMTNGVTGSIKCMLKSSNDKAMWVSIGPRLYYLEDGKEPKEISKLNVLHEIVDIMLAPDGRMWIIATNRIIVTTEKELLNSAKTFKSVSLDSSCGLINDIDKYSYSYLASDGTLYVCTDKGLLSIDTGGFEDMLNIAAPRLKIGGIYSDDGKQDFTNTPLSDDTQKISVGVSAVSYQPYSGYYLRYSLSGRDKFEYTEEVNGSNSFVYTNPSGGSYTLSVSLIDSKTHETLDTQQITFSKEYSYFEQYVFKVVVIFFVGFLIIVFAYMLTILKSVRERKKRARIQEISEQAMRAFTKVIDAKDSYTKGHSERVAKYSVEIAKRYGIGDERLDNIYYAALLHDIGKIGIPDGILKKSAKLTPEEYEVIKTHTTVGADILKDMTAVKNIQFGARDHHERYDGKGYPRGIKGSEISFEGKVIGAADAYDAMSTSRGYNTAFDKEHIKKEVMEQSGKQFDPEVAEILIKMIDDGYFDGNADGTEEKQDKK